MKSYSPSSTIPRESQCVPADRKFLEPTPPTPQTQLLWFCMGTGDSRTYFLKDTEWCDVLEPVFRCDFIGNKTRKKEREKETIHWKHIKRLEIRRYCKKNCRWLLRSRHNYINTVIKFVYECGKRLAPNRAAILFGRSWSHGMQLGDVKSCDRLGGLAA